MPVTTKNNEEEHPMWRYLMELGLDEKQKASAKEIKSIVMKETVKKRADVHIAEIELKDMLDKDPVDIKAVEMKLNQIEAVKTEILLLFIVAMEEVKSRLTAEQRKRFKEISETNYLVGFPLRYGMMHE